MNELHSFKLRPPAMEAVCQELAPLSNPKAIITGFMTYISSRRSLFSDPRGQAKRAPFRFGSSTC
jgi:hypothetical protein